MNDKQIKNIIFLDIDGVLNCQLFAEEQLKKKVKRKRNIDPLRVSWLNDLCKETKSAVVISSSWRHSGLKYCREALKKAGATFKIIDVTPSGMDCPRGWEIHKWLKDNCEQLFNVRYYDFYRYAIIDDDSDMLLKQAPHFFCTDSYSGLTPNTCYRIKRFFTHKTF